MSTFLVRPAGTEDLPRLVSLNQEAYPELVASGMVFEPAQVGAQHAVFPDGQLVVEEDGNVVGAIATLIVSSAAALRPHTWAEITSHGTFARHDASSGDALYLADIYVHPRAQGRGVGAALYDALFRLCERRRLARVVAGGRLWGYHEVAASMTPARYVEEVVSGYRKDRVLTSQLRAGFTVRGILERYLDDWRSASYATHLVWESSLARARDTVRPARTAASAVQSDGEAVPS